MGIVMCMFAKGTYNPSELKWEGGGYQEHPLIHITFPLSRMATITFLIFLSLHSFYLEISGEWWEMGVVATYLVKSPSAFLATKSHFWLTNFDPLSDVFRSSWPIFSEHGLILFSRTLSIRRPLTSSGTIGFMDIKVAYSILLVQILFNFKPCVWIVSVTFTRNDRFTQCFIRYYFAWSFDYYFNNVI